MSAINNNFSSFGKTLKPPITQSDTKQKHKSAVIPASVATAAALPCILHEIDFVCGSKILDKFIDKAISKIDKCFYKQPIANNWKNAIIRTGGAYASLALIGGVIGAGIGLLIDKVSNSNK